jgi:hypothetical protein
MAIDGSGGRSGWAAVVPWHGTRGETWLVTPQQLKRMVQACRCSQAEQRRSM